MFFTVIYVIFCYFAVITGKNYNIENVGPAQSCLKFPNSTAFYCEIRIREYWTYDNGINVTCLEENVILIQQNRTRPFRDPRYFQQHSPSSLSAHYENDNMPPMATFTCSSVDPTDFYFDGVEAPEFFHVSRSPQYNPYANGTNYLNVQILLSPETTGRFIFKSTGSQAIQHSIFVFSEREDKPFFLGADSVISAVEQNNSSVLLPCVSTDVSVNVTLFKLVNETKWTKLNTSTPSAQYDREIGFILNKAIASPGDYRCYSNDNNTAGDDPDDYVSLSVPAFPGNHSEPTSKLRIETSSGRGVCYSTDNSSILHFSNTFTSNPTESRLLVQCFDKKNIFCASRFYRQSTEGRRIKRSCPNKSTNCLWVTDLYGGVLHCAVLGPDGRHGESITKQYFMGLDSNIYDALNISSIDTNVLIRPDWWPTDTNRTNMKTNTEYYISCNMVGYIFSDYTFTVSFKFKNGSVIQQPQQYVNVYLSQETEEIICTNRLWSNNQAITTRIRINVTEIDCNQDEFKCGNGHCISMSYRCDGYNSCNDGTDELNCTTRRCGYGMFQCAEGHCISEFRKCNNIADCADASDESWATCYDTNCRSTQLRCMNGQCLSEASLCNGQVNCYDKSDENATECAKYYPKFENNEVEQTFTVNTMNELVCKIKPVVLAGLKPKLNWARKGEVVNFFSSTKRNRSNFHKLIQNVSERVWQDGSGSKVLLRFSNVSKEDEGEYTCFANNRLQRTDLNFKVKVKEIEIDTGCSHDLSKYQCRKRGCYYFQNMCNEDPEPTTTTTRIPSTTTTKLTTTTTISTTTTKAIMSAQTQSSGSTVWLTIVLTLIVVALIAGSVFTIRHRLTCLPTRFGIWRRFGDRERVLSGVQMQSSDNL